MEMIIGGAYQGKLVFAKEKYPDIVFLDAEKLTGEEPEKAGEAAGTQKRETLQGKAQDGDARDGKAMDGGAEYRNVKDRDTCDGKMLDSGAEYRNVQDWETCGGKTPDRGAECRNAQDWDTCEGKMLDREAEHRNAQDGETRDGNVQDDEIPGRTVQGSENGDGDLLEERDFPEMLWSARGIYGFHKLIRRELKEGRNPMELAEKLIEKNPGVILISDEVGYGVVPVDAFDREYREAVGRTCTRLASFSSRVTRVVCGVGTVIKESRSE